MEFYAHAKEEFDILSVFTDKTCSELRADVTEETINSIPNSFYKNMAHYMKKALILVNLEYKSIKPGEMLTLCLAEIEAKDIAKLMV